MCLEPGALRRLVVSVFKVLVAFRILRGLRCFTFGRKVVDSINNLQVLPCSTNYVLHP